ncbi:HPr family phosphocarrier protein [Cellulomonas sp. ATA003]|uniref:HPr family phosphocarrier protein n=1 Tax=Cellulomonas sp. ATA003 TaxID=3073064 RepID=UPI00287304EF|nr:HPr family phosphocarrier protein [Cellulomonas sp. ATA003]WNB86733.1 HPr family phosphocarrier protein [Cellulomonas sp. ATA003]
MPERRVTVAIPEGLHARPAALFVKLAGEQPATVTISKDGGDPVAANSILAVMTLGASAGDDVVLAADGEGADASLDALEQFLTTAEH